MEVSVLAEVVSVREVKCVVPTYLPRLAICPIEKVVHRAGRESPWYRCLFRILLRVLLEVLLEQVLLVRRSVLVVRGVYRDYSSLRVHSHSVCSGNRCCCCTRQTVDDQEIGVANGHVDCIDWAGLDHC